MRPAARARIAACRTRSGAGAPGSPTSRWRMLSPARSRDAAALSTSMARKAATWLRREALIGDEALFGERILAMPMRIDGYGEEGKHKKVRRILRSFV